MKNPQLIAKAVSIHFACDKKNMSCSKVLEDYVGIAGDFLNYMLNGTSTPQLERALGTRRYRTKLQLIERYIKQNEL